MAVERGTAVQLLKFYSTVSDGTARSSRFTGGNGFGFGAEIGISTQKLHVRGPMALPELTSTKYLICGSGQVRE